MKTKQKKNSISKKDKNNLRITTLIAVVSFIIFKAIISDWEHFKAGLTGHF